MSNISKINNIKYYNFASIVVNKIIKYQLHEISKNIELNNLVMLSETEYEYDNYVFICKQVKQKNKNKYLNIQPIFRWYVINKSVSIITTHTLVCSIYQHNTGSEKDILIFNSNLSLLLQKKYKKILELIYEYVRCIIDNTYDSIILDYINENDYVIMTKDIIMKNIKQEYDENNDSENYNK
jgi:hypothetical protein